MATKADTAESLVVLESFVGRIDGEERLFRAGENIRPTDPAVKKWPQFFGTATYPHDPRVERATAEPGEAR